MKILSLKQRESLVGASGAITYLMYSSIFWFYPFVWLLILSISKWRFIGKPQIIGLDNFKAVFASEIFWKSVGNSFRFMGFYLPIVLTLSMLFAVGLQRMKIGKTFVAMCFFVSSVASGVAYSIVFSKLFADNGPINQFLYSNFGFDIPWFTDSNFSMLTIAIMVSWKMVGYYGLIIYAGLEAIPKSYIEAAALDGVTGIKRFFKITLPLINNQLMMVLIAAVTISFGIFTEPYMITGGGPMQSTITPMVVMYEAAFKSINPTLAATMSIFMAVISYVVIRVSKKLMEKEVDLI